MNGYFMTVKGTCVTTCPLSTFADEWMCTNCSTNCLTCLNVTYCNQCQPNAYFFNGACFNTCPESTILLNGQCQTCPQGCLLCDSPNNCLACVQPFFFWGGRCIQVCPVGYYQNSTASGCSPCNVTCQTCVGPSTGQCTGCATGYYLNNGTCLAACPVGTFPSQSGLCLSCPASCQICTSLTNCWQCANSSYTLTSNGSCTSPITCDPSCLTCFGSSNNSCLTCKPGNYLLNTRCLTSCPLGYYVDPSNNKSCLTCSPPCATCLNNT